MKVTKHGKKYDDGKPFKGKCDSCGCEVEVSRNEIKRGDDGRGEEAFYYISCPECIFQIYFHDRRLGNEREQRSGGWAYER